MVGVKYQSVQEWERAKGTAPSRRRQHAVAKALGISVPELVAGAGSETTLTPRQELLLEMFDTFTPEQQREQLNYIRALYNANRVTQKFAGKKLRTIGNEEVEVAFGKVPQPTRPIKRRGTTQQEDDPE